MKNTTMTTLLTDICNYIRDKNIPIVTARELKGETVKRIEYIEKFLKQGFGYCTTVLPVYGHFFNKNKSEFTMLFPSDKITIAPYISGKVKIAPDGFKIDYDDTFVDKMLQCYNIQPVPAMYLRIQYDNIKYPFKSFNAYITIKQFKSNFSLNTTLRG